MINPTHQFDLSAAIRFLAARCWIVALLLCCGCPSPKPKSAAKPDVPSARVATAQTTAPQQSSESPTKFSDAQIAEAPNSKTEPVKVPATGPGMAEQSQLVPTAPLQPAPLQPAPLQPEPLQPAPSQPEAPQTWSVTRVLALEANGPIVVDVSVNIDGRSLDEAATAATEKVIAYIEKDLERPWSWEKLLDHPLIRSGWLGNLTPDNQQRAQLINMYNRNGDDQVDDAEIAAFFSRGLARSSAFKFSNIGYAPGTVLDGSPWQQLDSNQDSSLDQTEIAAIANRVARYDLNADQVLTPPELQADRMTAQAGMTNSSASQLMSDSTMTVNSKDEPSRVANELLNKYTLLGFIERKTWPAWTDAQWSEFDSDADGKLSKMELERVATVPPHLNLKISFFQTDGRETQIQVQTRTPADSLASNLVWNSRLNLTGQASSKSFALALSVNDSFTSANQRIIRNQLSAALSNPQLAMFIRTQLQLAENAFEVLDADQDSKLNDEEFERAWMWLSAVRGNRVLARWMLADTAWFQVADADADNRVTEMELKKFAMDLPGLDQDQDKLLTPREIPTAVRLEIARTDSRLSFTPPPTSVAPTSESGWFAATDTNSDGSLSSAEFLGSEKDFREYDVDGDDFISQQEAFKRFGDGVQ